MSQRVSESAGQQVSGRTRHFRDLLVWQKSMQLAKGIYEQTAVLPKSEVFGLQGQMRRAAVSIPSNIAEGHGRLSDHLFRVFLAQARGSLCELETQIQLCEDLGFMQAGCTQELRESCNEVGRMLNGLIKALKPKEERKPLTR
jgi:four helix bundle protein